MSSRLELYDLPWNSLTPQLENWGISAFHSKKIWRYLYRQKVTSFDEMDALRPNVLSLLRDKAQISSPSLVKELTSEDGQTRKSLLQLADGERIESVLMRYPGRTTACISTQVGCAMGCVFCATGQMGFSRHLSPGEIVAQVIFLARSIAGQGEMIRNVVLMGMGEPLHNLDATLAAVAIMCDDNGLAISPRKITLSTVGLPDAIRLLADENSQINLAVSLHAATDKERSEIVPVNRRWNLAELIDACHYYCKTLDRRIFIEWALIDGKNDSIEHAQRIGKLLQGLDAHINLIPLNPTVGYRGSPSSTDVTRRFQVILGEYGFPSTVRRRKGIDIEAGCGQLTFNADES